MALPRAASVPSSGGHMWPHLGSSSSMQGHPGLSCVCVIYPSPPLNSQSVSSVFFSWLFDYPFRTGVGPHPAIPPRVPRPHSWSFLLSSRAPPRGIYWASDRFWVPLQASPGCAQSLQLEELQDPVCVAAYTVGSHRP